MGSQRPCEGFRAQITSRAKFNKDVKIRKADFFLNISPDGEIYHIREADISRCEATYHSRKARISLERSANITRAKREYQSSEASRALRARSDGAQHFRPCESIDSVQNPEAELRDFEAQ